MATATHETASNGHQFAEVLDIPAEEYHEREEFSRSQLEDFITDPLLFRGRYLDKIWPMERKSAFDIGTGLHDAMEQFLKAVGPHEQFSDKIVEIPADVLAGGKQRRGKKFEAWAAKHPGKVLLKEHEVQQITWMCEGIRDNEDARKLLFQPGPVEHSIVWADPACGLRRRCRPDKYIPSLRMICDLKTVHTLDRRKLATHIEDLGYHRQAAYYQDGLKAATGEDYSFAFVCVLKVPPYRCEVFELGEPVRDRAGNPLLDSDGNELLNDIWVSRGREQNLQALQQLAECLQTDTWDRPGKIQILEPPYWATKEN